jgi:hypothetical protein
LREKSKKLGRSVILLATGTRPCYVMLIHLNGGVCPGGAGRKDRHRSLHRGVWMR